ncbi:MAG: serine/threonine protein kinase, partial [Deltaproteobacteria bacterium]|nr:serine/threonine protein kinase [Deltaproteobacteria bacterium]
MSNSTDSSASKSLRRAVSDPEEMVGHVIDERYRLKRFISQGGMGAVFEAEHVTIQKSIAVKILHPSLVQVPELVQRFEREAFAIGRIDHPNCIRVSDFGKLDDGALFLVMEFLDGVSLADRIDDGGPLSTEHALRILRHVVRGLAHVHRAGIVHRDVKPENIVLVDKDDDEDFAKLLDFGIAKLVGEAQRPDDHQLTQAGIAFGTPNYMSPEQTLGDSVDGRSDLYQATVVLFEMLAGRPP